MTITTAASERTHRRKRGFTLVELIVTMSLASLVLAGVFASVIFVTRSCLATTDYAGMDGEARESLEVFARDARMASGVSDFSSTGVSLHVPTATGTSVVSYRYVPEDQTFYQAYGTPAQKALVTGVDQFALRGYDSVHGSTMRPVATKQIQLELRAIRTGPAKLFASNNVISARYVLRNKVVSE
jgi:prepilin-type N-terminal cleavage/methylation domain-containing protein